MSISNRETPKYRMVKLFLLLVCLVLLGILNQSILNDPVRISSQDFSQFWASGRLNFAGENPYNPFATHQIKNSLAGTSEEITIVSITYNPPWVMPLLMVFSWIPYSISRLVWLLMNIAILLFCAVWLWEFYGGDAKQRWVAILTVVTFISVFLVLSQGQITPLLLLGIVGFLDQIENKKNDLLAGFFAALISIKPQLFYLFWIALLFWVIYYKRWRVLVGVFIMISVATFISLKFNPGILFQYVEVLMNYSPRAWITPTLGSYLRMLFGEEKFWLQFVPPLLGSFWFLWYWRKHSRMWSWKTSMPDMIFVSLLTIPYGWTHDLVLLILPILYALIKLIHTNRSKLIIINGVIFVMINILLITVMILGFQAPYYGWYIIALIIWFFIVQRSAKEARPYTAYVKR